MSVSLHHLRHSQWPSQDSPAADISREEQEASDSLWPPQLLLHPERGSSRLDGWDQWSGMLGQREGDLRIHLLFAVKPHCLLGTSSLHPAAAPRSQLFLLLSAQVSGIPMETLHFCLTTCLSDLRR